jgi:chromosome segregation ATPase
MQSMVKNDLTQDHTVNELKEMLRDFDNKRSQQMDQKEDLEREVKMLKTECHRIQNQETALQADFGRLTAMKEAHLERLELRFQKMMQLGNSYALADALTSITQSQHNHTQNTSFTTGDSSRPDMSMADTDAQEPVLDIPRSDMDDFGRAVERKEAEIRDSLKECKTRHQLGEDDIMAKITKIRSDIGTIKSRRAELNAKSAKARETIKALTIELGQVPRLRETDLEEVRLKAAQFERERKQVNSDPRKSEIELEIRDSQDKLDKLKRDLDDDKIALRELQQSSDSQQAINVLRQQIVQDVLNLEEVLRDHAFEAQSFNFLSFPKDLPRLENMGENGSELTDVITGFVDEVTTKYEALKFALERSNADMKKIEAIVSERKGALNSDQNSVRERKLRMEQFEAPGGSLDVIAKVFDELKTHHRKLGEPIPDGIDESRPVQLLEYLNTRVKEIEAESLDGITAETIKKILKRLWSLVRSPRLRNRFPESLTLSFH